MCLALWEFAGSFTDYSSPQVDRLWGIWGSYYNKGDYTIRPTHNITQLPLGPEYRIVGGLGQETFRDLGFFAGFRVEGAFTNLLYLFSSPVTANAGVSWPKLLEGQHDPNNRISHLSMHCSITEPLYLLHIYIYISLTCPYEPLHNPHMKNLHRAKSYLVLVYASLPCVTLWMRKTRGFMKGCKVPQHMNLGISM